MRHLHTSSLIALLLVSIAPAKTSSTLADYLAKHPWNAVESGPLLVLEPEVVATTKPPMNLSAFERKKVQMGDLTAIVPASMVIIDDSLKGEPNLFQGMSTREKVIYLLRSLSESQLRTISSRGVCAADLQDDQRPILDAIIPKPAAWSSWVVDSEGATSDSMDGKLSDQERGSVRLKVVRLPELAMSDGEPQSFMDMNMAFWGGDKINNEEERVGSLNTGDEPVPEAKVFGQKVRATVPNALKPSDLTDVVGGMGKSVSIPPKSTVREILQAVHSVGGPEIVSDYRVASRAIWFYGKQAVVKDLLRALSLAVTGTYRRVGSVYFLTSDLVGAGPRQFRIARWSDPLTKKSESLTNRWLAEIESSGGFKCIGFDSASSVSSSPELKSLIEEGDKTSEGAEVAQDKLTPAMAKFVQEHIASTTPTPQPPFKFRIKSKYAFRFVLPDGTETHMSEDLGDAYELRHPQVDHSNRAVEPPPVPVEVLTSKGPAVLASAEDPESARLLVKGVAEISGSQLWLLTHDKATLEAAIEHAKAVNIKVGLAIRPWRLTTNDPDRNLLGQSGREVVDEVLRIVPEKSRLLALKDPISTWMSPTDPSLPTVWSSYRDLAAVPGSDGTMLLETQPFGYGSEGWIGFDWTFNASGDLARVVLEQGFSVGLRERFIRQEGADPIDISTMYELEQLGLDQPFFPGVGFAGSYVEETPLFHKSSEVRSKWLEFKRSQNLAEIERLAALLSDRPIFMEPRRDGPGVHFSQEMYVIKWQPGTPFPHPVPNGTAANLTGGAFALAPISAVNPQKELVDCLFDLDWCALSGNRKPNVTLLVDAHLIPPSKLASVIKQWIKPVPVLAPLPE